MVGESAVVEAALSRPPLIRLDGKAALDNGWPSGPFEDPDGWRRKLDGHTGNVGMVMGRGLLAVDVDLYKPGAEGAWEALQTDTGLDGDTVRQLTGRDGLHVLYRYPEDLHVPSVPLTPRGYPGIEIKADGGCIAVAPSKHPDTGRRYSWEEGWGPGDRPVADAPAGLLELIGAGTATTAAGHWRALDDEQMAELIPADVEAARLLCEHFGGHDPALVNGTVGVWRPGKSPSDGSASVTIGHIGPGVAKVWTDGWPPFEQNKVYDLGALRQMAGVAPHIDVPAVAMPAGYRLWQDGDDAVPDPVLSRDVYTGPVGDYLDLLDGATEAHPAPVGIALLAGLGTVIGRRASYRAGRIVHHANLFAAVVGPSSEGAKGVADAEALALLEPLFPNFLSSHGVGGLGSGEVLVRLLADDQEPPAEKRRIVQDAELSGILKVVRRDGSILGDVLRKAFDYGPLRHSSIGNGSSVASGHHIAVVGSITPEELRAHIDGLAIANGFANRFLYVWSRATVLLPDGGDLDPAAVERVRRLLAEGFEVLEGRMPVNGTVHLPFDSDGKQRWDSLYRVRRFGTGEGIIRALTGRHVAHAARLALIYAVLDGSPTIGASHVDAAAGWCDYSTASAVKAFGGQLTVGKAGKLLAAVRDAMPDGITRTDLHAGPAHHWPAGELDNVTADLEADHLVLEVKEPTAGRTRSRYFALAPVREGRK